MFKNRISAMRRNDEGFTLIELLVVIVVLGILASIVVFGIAKFRADAVAACTAANNKTLSVAQDAYAAQGGPANAPAGNAATPGTLVGEGYLKEAPATC